MKIFLVAILMYSNVSASDCESIRPGEKYFSIEYMIEYFGAPNFDDICFEDYKNLEIENCYDEVTKYKAWLSCLKLR